MKKLSKSCDVSVVVISYNTRKLTGECLRSVFAETRDVSFEVIVVDNASSDGSVAEITENCPQAKLVASSENIGFARANNLAMQGAHGRYVLLLNPDTVVLNGAIDKLVRFADSNPEYSIFGGRTLFPDGTLNPSCCWGKPTIWNTFCRAVGLSAAAPNSEFLNEDTYGGWQRDTVREVDLVSGCFLLMRRELWEHLAGFDASYFMYGEDWDLCLRAQAIGGRCLHCPDAEIVHYGGASEPVRADKLVRLFQTKVKLYRVHWGVVRSRILILMLWVWALRCIVMDSVLGYMGNATRARSGRAWREVLGRRREWTGDFVSDVPQDRDGAFGERQVHDE